MEKDMPKEEKIGHGSNYDGYGIDENGIDLGFDDLGSEFFEPSERKHRPSGDSYRPSRVANEIIDDMRFEEELKRKGAERDRSRGKISIAAAPANHDIRAEANEEPAKEEPKEEVTIDDEEKTKGDDPILEYYGVIDDESTPTRQKIYHPNRKFKDEEASRFAREESKRRKTEAIAKSREEKEILNSETRFHDVAKKAAHERAANDRVLDSVQGKKEIERAEIKSSEIGLKALAEMSPEAQRAYYEQLADELWALEAELERKPGNQKLQSHIEELKMLRGRLLRERETSYEKTPNLSDQSTASEYVLTGQMPDQGNAKTRYLNSQNQVFSTREDALESEAK